MREPRGALRAAARGALHRWIGAQDGARLQIVDNVRLGAIARGRVALELVLAPRCPFRYVVLIDVQQCAVLAAPARLPASPARRY